MRSLVFVLFYPINCDPGEVKRSLYMTHVIMS